MTVHWIAPAGVTQLVECLPSKQVVARSSRVSRSTSPSPEEDDHLLGIQPALNCAATLYDTLVEQLAVVEAGGLPERRSSGAPTCRRDHRAQPRHGSAIGNTSRVSDRTRSLEKVLCQQAASSVPPVPHRSLLDRHPDLVPCCHAVRCRLDSTERGCALVE